MIGDIPHQFEDFRQGECPASAVIGAGLSALIVPAAYDLIMQNQDAAEKALKIDPIDELPDNEEALYIWADQALAAIDGANPMPGKLRLAKALGILSDPKWISAVDFEGTAPRHRVVARFAIDELWKDLWSLNWDIHIERALEAVGMKRDAEQLGQTPWKRTYSTIITDSDYQNEVGKINTLNVLKPHGCVRALLEAETAFENGDIDKAKKLSDRFLITKSELQERDTPLDNKFFNKLGSDLQSNPLFAVGWRVGEPYLKKVVNKALKDKVGDSELGQLNIVDINFNDDGHVALADCYGLNEDEIFFQVSKNPKSLTADRFFLWLQAKYCVELVRGFAPPDESIALTHASEGLEIMAFDDLLLDWADSFLPAWVRFCWRAKLVPGGEYDQDLLGIDRKDAYVSLKLVLPMRPELISAAVLLAKLLDSAESWNFTRFPGSFWNESSGRLVVPLPIWGDLHELSSIKPTISAYHQLGHVQTIAVLPIHHDPDQCDLTPDQEHKLKEHLARAIRVPGLSKVSNIDIVQELFGAGGEDNG